MGESRVDRFSKPDSIMRIKLILLVKGKIIMIYGPKFSCSSIDSVGVNLWDFEKNQVLYNYNIISPKRQYKDISNVLL
jgi:hypothetical protein